MRSTVLLPAAALLALACLVLSGGNAEEKAAKKLPPDLAAVPEKAAFLWSVRPADLVKSAMFKTVTAKMSKADLADVTKPVVAAVGLAPEAIERFTFVMTASDPYPLFFVRAGKDLDKGFLKKFIPGGQEKTSGQRKYFGNKDRAAVLLGDREYLVSIPIEVEKFLENESTASDELKPALALAAKGHTAVFAVRTAALGIAEEELKKEMEPLRPLVKSRYATMTVDVGTDIKSRLNVVFASDEDAKEGEKALEAARKAGRSFLAQGRKSLEKNKEAGTKEILSLLDLADAALKDAPLKRGGKGLTADAVVKIDGEKVALMATAAVKRVRQAADRMRSVNNLKQIALAMHNYHDANEAFPTRAIFDKKGKALLSWRVAILPYLGQDDLYKQFKLDEPWDSKHNKKLLAKMPDVYRVPGDKHKQPHSTFYMGFSGKNAFFDGQKSTRIADVTDGLSNTLMIVEAGKEVPWTKPEDIDFDENKALPKLGGLFDGGFNSAFCDGSVRFLSGVKEKTLKAMITRNGGEVIRND